MIKAIFFDLGDTLIKEEAFLAEEKVETVLYVHEVLESLMGKYKLAVICDTDASGEEVDALMKEAGIRQYFDTVVVSSEVGVAKPHERIFWVALRQLNLQPQEVIMVGNRISKDILGGNKIGMKTVLFRWNDRYPEEATDEMEEPDYTITSLKEILPIIAELV
ncbi:MAG: putative HAD-hydrolase [Candidatus Bathyarchaeota archaeon BA1]|nr:MAG: putative HAD-hydrolase [Candidatus Bathyarchaeota archaeon BA1]